MRVGRTEIKLSHAAIALTAGVTLIVGLAGAASAHDLRTYSSLYNGSESFSWHTATCNRSLVHPQAGINDVRADGYSVYVQYYRQSTQANGLQTLWNTNGSGTTVLSSCGIDPVSRIRGCTSRPIIPDVCASWRE